MIKIVEDISDISEFIEDIEESSKIQEIMTKEIDTAIEKISCTLENSQNNTEEIFIEISAQFKTSKELEDISKELNLSTKKLNEKVKNYKIIKEEKISNLFENHKKELVLTN